MMPRPRSRKKPVDVPDADALAEECAAVLKAQRAPAVAVVAGIREWRMMRRTVAWRSHGDIWPGGEETFARVPVIIHRRLEGIRVVWTQADLEELLLGPGLDDAS